jgi:hypothetical protein
VCRRAEVKLPNEKGQDEGRDPDLERDDQPTLHFDLDCSAGIYRPAPQ